jgi:transposase-like protein
VTRKTHDLSRHRAEIILQVRAGQISATEAARQLGISRKTYYQWEQRALSGMLAGLENRSPGRPSTPKPDLETRRLQQQVIELEKRLKLLTEAHQLQTMLAEHRPPTHPPATKPTRSNRSSVKPQKKT